MATLIGATLSIPAALTSATLLRRSWLALATQHSRRVVLLGASTRSLRILAATANGPAIAETEAKAPGAFTDVPDVINNDHVQIIGNWAVEEHNKEAHDSVKFVEVVKAQTQIVDGTNYKLFIDGKDIEGNAATYLVVVYVKAYPQGGIQWKIELTSFIRLLK